MSDDDTELTSQAEPCDDIEKQHKNVPHSPGPLDGSLYAKISKNKNAPGEELNQEKDIRILKDSTNQDNSYFESANQVESRRHYVVLNGNKLLYKPRQESELTRAPLADVSEFEYSTLTKQNITSSETITSQSKTCESDSLSQEEEIHRSATILVNDVINKRADVTESEHNTSGVSQVSNRDVIGTSYVMDTSGSETALSMEPTDDESIGEISQHDSDSSSSSDENKSTEKSAALESNTGGGSTPSTLKGSISPETLGGSISPAPLEGGIQAAHGKTTLEAVSTIHSDIKEVTNGTSLDQATTYDKGPEYAVPMRDMKITTVPSKRAVLMSAASDDGIVMNSQETHKVNHQGQAVLQQRDSLYDEANNAFVDAAAGYSTIEEYANKSQKLTQMKNNQEKQHNEADISNLPEDVQALLNGLQEGPFCSDIDSGFHGSSVTLTHNRGNMTSQSSSEATDPYPGHSSPVATKSYFTEKVIPHNGSEVQHAHFTNAPEARGTYNGRQDDGHVTMATQTLPEPKEAKVEKIIMRTVYQKENELMTPYSDHPTFESPPPVINNISPESMNIPHSQQQEDPYFMEQEQEEAENIMNFEEQIRHTQQHLQFLKEQQEKLLRRKQDRSRMRETLKRNSSAFESHTQGYISSTNVYSTLPRQPQRFVDDYITTKQHQIVQQMPPVANVNQTREGGTSAGQHNQSNNNGWVSHGRSLDRRASDNGYDRQRPLILHSKNNDVNKNKGESIMTSPDLQMQLAELDKCIAQLTSLDIPDPVDKPDPSPAVVHRRRPYSSEIDNKLNFPVQNGSLVSAPRPPTRSRSSFDSYKRLSQDFDLKRRSISDTDFIATDDVFSPTSQVRMKKPSQPSHPPMTSVTRRQQYAPAPPPKHRVSLEDRLSPHLMLALMSNPGARPKENIHSYKEDLDPDNAPETPNFPTTPSTPYVNNTSPVRAKSPPGLVKTPLSALNLKSRVTAEQDLPSSSNVGGDQVANGHVKETALLSDGALRAPQRLDASETAPKIPQKTLINGQQTNNYNYGGYNATSMAHGQRQQQQQQQLLPNHLNTTNIHPSVMQQQPHLPPTYNHNHSGTSQSSHSPAATSSNSRHGSSDSLDGPSQQSTRHSNSSVLSTSSNASSPQSGVPLSPNNVMRPGSQLSSYERNNHMMLHGTRSGDDSLGSPQSGRTSSSSISDVERLSQEVSHASIAPKFIRDTTAYWYKPDITRDQALAMLRNKPPGSFVVRDSRCFPGAFGLALKVDKLPPNVQAKPGVDVMNEYVRHFLIEPSTRGVKLKGCQNEPVFGSLSALVYQHSITPLALPCKLIIPTSDQEIKQLSPGPRTSQTEVAQNSAHELLKQGAACNVLYIGTADTESLTGPQAIERAIRETFKAAQSNSSKTSIVHFKVSPQGITLTDNARKIFFRRHYPTTTITFCGLDPQGNPGKGQKERRFDTSKYNGNPHAWLFGFVARKQSGSSDNSCHVFAELDQAQPARAIVNFVSKVLIGTSRQNHP